MRSSAICIILFLLVGFAAAGRRGRKKPTIVTYNTALIDGIGLFTLGPDVMTPSRTARRDAIIEQLKNTPADVLCLQEAWYGEDVGTIIDELKPKFPHSFSALHDSSGSLIMDGLSSQPACPSDVFIPFLNCLIPANCTAETTQAGLVMCINASCGTEFMNLPQACWTCFITTGQNFTELALQCTDQVLPGPYRKINDAGLVLLSKRKMRNQAYVNLHPGTRQVLPRGYIEAEVKGIGQIVCAHTTFYDVDVYFEFELQAVVGFTNYFEQGTFELNTIVERFSGLKRVLLPGDYNTGPACPTDVSAEFSGQFAILAEAFNVDPLPQCTFCNSTENAYNGVRTAIVIDHILSKGYRSLRKKRIFDDVTVDGFPLSDHFGVIQKFKCLRYRYRH